MALRGENGTCTTPRFFTPPDGTTWTEWPDEAAAIVANAGRRHGSFPALIAPALSPPATKMPNGNNVCIRLGVQACASWNSAQKWSLSDGVTPGDGKLTVIRSAVPTNSTMHSCWKAQLQREKAQFGMPSVQCELHNQGVMCEDGCMPLPPHANAAASPGCPKAGAWFIHSNGTAAESSSACPSFAHRPLLQYCTEYMYCTLTPDLGRYNYQRAGAVSESWCTVPALHQRRGSTGIGHRHFCHTVHRQSEPNLEDCVQNRWHFRN